MVATLVVYEANGASPTYTDSVSNVRFCTDDAQNPGTNYPIPIPAASFNYSYWKHVGLKVTVAPSSSVSNFRHYTDGAIGWAMGTGGMLNRGNRDSGAKGCPAANYQQATGAGHTQGTTGPSISDSSNGHAYYRSQSTPTTNMATDTSGAPATIDSSTYTSVNDRTYMIVMQVKLASDGTRGAQSAETFTWLYDEV